MAGSVRKLDGRMKDGWNGSKELEQGSQALDAHLSNEMTFPGKFCPSTQILRTKPGVKSSSQNAAPYLVIVSQAKRPGTPGAVEEGPRNTDAVCNSKELRE